MPLVKCGQYDGKVRVPAPPAAVGWGGLRARGRPAHQVRPVPGQGPGAGQAVPRLRQWLGAELTASAGGKS